MNAETEKTHKNGNATTQIFCDAIKARATKASHGSDRELLFSKREIFEVGVMISNCRRIKKSPQILGI
jgi:hypothetical protein